MIFYSEADFVIIKLKIKIQFWKHQPSVYPQALS